MPGPPKLPSLSEQLASTPLSGANAGYVEALYEQYLRIPPGSIRAGAAISMRCRPDRRGERAHGPVIAAVAARTQAGRLRTRRQRPRLRREASASEKQAAVSRLMQIYSNRGHLIAQIDPLGLLQRPRPRVLDLDYAGLSDADLDTEFYTASRNEWIAQRATLREIIARLETVYCGHIGAEFAHVSNTDERLWLQDEFQLGRMQHRFSDRGAAQSAVAADCRRGTRALSAYQVCRPEALLARGRRCADCVAE